MLGLDNLYIFAFLRCGSRFSNSLSEIDPEFSITRYHHGRSILPLKVEGQKISAKTYCFCSLLVAGYTLPLTTTVEARKEGPAEGEVSCLPLFVCFVLVNFYPFWRIKNVFTPSDSQTHARGQPNGTKFCGKFNYFSLQFKLMWNLTNTILFSYCFAIFAMFVILHSTIPPPFVPTFFLECWRLTSKEKIMNHAFLARWQARESNTHKSSNLSSNAHNK